MVAPYPPPAHPPQSKGAGRFATNTDDPGRNESKSSPGLQATPDIPGGANSGRILTCRIRTPPRAARGQALSLRQAQRVGEGVLDPAHLVAPRLDRAQRPLEELQLPVERAELGLQRLDAQPLGMHLVDEHLELAGERRGLLGQLAQRHQHPGDRGRDRLRHVAPRASSRAGHQLGDRPRAVEEHVDRRGSSPRASFESALIGPSHGHRRQLQQRGHLVAEVASSSSGCGSWWTSTLKPTWTLPS